MYLYTLYCITSRCTCIHCTVQPLDVPVCKSPQPRIYGVSKREPVKVLCEVEANPAEVQFKWTFNNSAEMIKVKDRVENLDIIFMKLSKDCFNNCVKYLTLAKCLTSLQLHSMTSVPSFHLYSLRY